VLGSLNGYPAWVDIVYDPDEAYSTTLNTLRVNGLNATIAIQAPYSFEEPESWWAQVLEAEAWTADNNYVPVMLNQMGGIRWALGSFKSRGNNSQCHSLAGCTGNILVR
jgi:homoserine acetyltransferase